MDDLTAISNWVLASLTSITKEVFTKWGFVGMAIFCFPLLRRLIHLFRKTF